MAKFDFTLAGNFNSTEVTGIPATPSNSAIPVSANFLFDRANILSFEEGTPEQKIVASVDWSRGWLAATAKPDQLRFRSGGQQQFHPGL